MKLVRSLCFVLPALLGCSIGPVNLGDPGRDVTSNDTNGGGSRDGELPGETQDDPGTVTPVPTNPSSAPESVLESATLDVGQIRAFDMAAGKLYYSALHDDRMSLFRYDVASKSNALVDQDYGGSPFTADAGGFYYFGLTSEPVRKAIVGMPLTSTTHKPEWFAGVETYATAVALDQQKVYFIERGELHTYFRIANRGAFVSSPKEAGASGPSVPNAGEYFEHLLVDQGVGFAAGDRGRLVRFDLEIATVLLATGGPNNGFVMDAVQLYWADGTELKALSKTAAPGSAPTVIGTLPADATNLVAGVGSKGVYVLSYPQTGGSTGEVLRVDPVTGTSTKLVTELSGLTGGAFVDRAFYFATSQGIFRLREE